MIETKRMIELTLLSEVIHLILPYLISKVVTGHSNEYLLTQSWLLNFDGIHYFENTYQFQQNHAFLPFFVGAIQAIKALLGHSFALLLLIIMNRGLFVLSAFEINRILDMLTVGKNKKLTEIGTIAFLFNPASIFFHVMYTESLFCFFTCKAIRYSLQGKNQWLTAVLLSLGVSLRSNGLFLSPIIGLGILNSFFIKLKHLKLSSFVILAKGIAMLGIISFPFIIHLIFSYLNVCKWSQNPPNVCENMLPNIYSYVQEKYWSVGLFSYFKISNWLFIALGLPSIALSIYGVMVLYDTQWSMSKKGLYLSYTLLLLTTIAFTNIQSSTRFFSTHPFFYYSLAFLGLKHRAVRIWTIFYCLLGMFLYPAGFPWT